MKRITIAALAAVLAAVLIAPAAVATERAARILSVTPGFRPETVTLTSITFDPVSRVTTITLTPHCFDYFIQFDEHVVEGPFRSEVAWIDVNVTQPGRSGIDDTFPGDCDVANTLVIDGPPSVPAHPGNRLTAGPATFVISTYHVGFSFFFPSTMTVKALL